MAHCPQINNTTIIGTSAVSYDSTPLPCTDVKACDDLNTILTKFDNVICSAIDSVNNLSEDIMNITEDLMIITEEIENINNQIFICCPICDFTVTATELPVCQFTATANELPDSTTTTTTSTSSGGSTTTTTTLFPPSRNTTPVFNDAGFICLHPYDTLQCGFNPECVSYYYDLITCPNLTVGCTLYTDIGLTNVFTTAFDDYFYSDGFGGQVSYQISASGQIVNILPCPTPPPLAQYCSSCVAINIDGTSFNVGGGVTATCTYTGDVINYPNPYPVQYTLDTFPANCAWLGRNRNLFTLTLNFSQPITSINIYQGGGDL